MKVWIRNIMINQGGKLKVFAVASFLVLLAMSDSVWGYTGKGTSADPYLVTAQSGLEEILTGKGNGDKWVYIGINDTVTINKTINVSSGKFRIFASGGNRTIRRSIGVKDEININRKYCFKVSESAEVVFGYNKNSYYLTMNGRKNSFGVSVFSAGMINVVGTGTVTIGKKGIVSNVKNQDTTTQAGAIKSTGNLILNGEISSCNGSNGGGVTIKGGSFTMNEGASVHGCVSTSEGGGIYVAGGANFVMNGGSVYGCSSTEEGGGIFITGDKTNASIKKGNIYNNSSSKTAGGVFSGYQALLMVGGTDSGPSIHDNSAKGSGGGIRCNGGVGSTAGGTTYFYKADIYNNKSDKHGGGIACGGNSTLYMANINVYGNYAKGNSGGITITANTTGSGNGRVILTNSIINENTSEKNGGGINVDSDIYISNTRFYNNRAYGMGGGIFINSSECSISATASIDCNTGDTHGGGIFINEAATLKMVGSCLNVNKSNGKGKGIYVKGSLDMSAAAKIGASNEVYLPKDKFINISGKLTSTSGYIAYIDSEIKTEGTKLVKVNYDNKTGEDELYYSGNAKTEYTSAVKKKFYSYAEGDGKILRPGNYANGYNSQWIIISKKYEIKYDKNAEDAKPDGELQENKFWNENIVVDNYVLTRKGYELDSGKHWNSNADTTGSTYKPGSILSENANMTLYAAWVKNGVTKLSIMANDRYYIVKQNITLSKEEVLKKVTVEDDLLSNTRYEIRVVEIRDVLNGDVIYKKTGDDVDFKMEDYLDTDSRGMYELVLEAGDEKNETTAEGTMRVNVLQTEENRAVIRFISDKYLWTIKEDSKWNEKLKTLLQESLNRKKGQGEFRISYSHDEIKQIRDDIKDRNYMITEEMNKKLAGEW